MTLEHFGGPVKTLLFTASVADGEDLCRAFQTAGYDFRQSTYRDSDTETEALVDAFGRDHFTGLVSVSKFTKGFDQPNVLCGIDARPNRGSLAEVIQKMGRVMRSAEGKEYGIWLDHAENVLRWYDEIGDFWANGVEQLDEGKKKQTTKTAQVDRPDVVCQCGYVLPPGAPSCPLCGRDRPRRRAHTEVVAGRVGDELHFDSATTEEWANDEAWVWQQVSRLALEKRDFDVPAARRTASGYYKGIYDTWPSRDRELEPCEGPAERRVERRVKYNLIRYHNRKNGR